ncbi:hypothetical protein [Fibrella aquatica]|uniref:hypothetical protein n=1 Tax=Fibrella aquatica TaxID=3242487 RepID=UPI0035212D7F
MDTKLKQLYSLRNSFSVLGLTGRTGSGCSDLASILSKDFSQLNKLRSIENIPDSLFKKKFKIVYNFSEVNWKEYKIIGYKKVLLLILLPKLLEDPSNTLLFDYYRNKLKDIPNDTTIKELKDEIQNLIQLNLNIIIKIRNLGELSEIRDELNLEILSKIFWGAEFNTLSDAIDQLLKAKGVTERIMLLHHTASNFRRSGQPFKTEKKDPKYIYTIAKVINRLIKATKQTQGENGCHVVIDSLRNSLEINFFKERYSAFYLVALKSDRRRTSIAEVYKDMPSNVIERLLEMDEMEYKSSDFQKGFFYAPDVQNCIQMADYHINNHELDSEFLTLTESAFYSLDEQLIKLQGLIQQPGLITPEPTERSMQLAYTAKLNSGCISRQVGAVVTDDEFSTKAIGWNDVPKGAIPCSLRNVKEIDSSNFGFTQFEIGKGLKETEQISTETNHQEIDKESADFKDYVKANYNDTTLPESKLGGRNCPYCFKTAYNSFSGEKNQVHTRSLHAEENAMLQISRNGGQGLKDGYLFTTASPCELCAKKAYQLGIVKIYYIDPYPGISRNHILKSMKDRDPKMVLFSGAVGRAYHKLYEPFMSQKDELSLLTDFKLEPSEKVKAKSLRTLLKENSIGHEIAAKEIETLFEGDNEQVFDTLFKLLEKGLKSSSD